MNSILEYKGYHATIVFDADDGILVGKIMGLSDSLNFHAISAEEVDSVFHQCVDNYLDYCKSIGKNPDKEYNGVFNVRVPSELHKALCEEATREETSLNSIVVNACREYIEAKQLDESTQQQTDINKYWAQENSNYGKKASLQVLRGGYSEVLQRAVQ